MKKTIFRKIGGRIVPITVEKVVTAQKHNPDAVDISIKLREGFNRIGEFWAQQSWRKQSRFIVGSQINPQFRKQGLGKEFYKKLGEEIRKHGGRFMVGSTDNVTTIRKVREAAGKTRSFVDRGGPYTATTHVTILKKLKKKEK